MLFNFDKFQVTYIRWNNMNDHLLICWNVRAYYTHTHTLRARKLTSELQLQLFSIIDVIKWLIDRIKQFPIILVQMQLTILKEKEIERERERERDRIGTKNLNQKKMPLSPRCNHNHSGRSWWVVTAFVNAEKSTNSFEWLDGAPIVAAVIFSRQSASHFSNWSEHRDLFEWSNKTHHHFAVLFPIDSIKMCNQRINKKKMVCELSRLKEINKINYNLFGTITHEFYYQKMKNNKIWPLSWLGGQTNVFSPYFVRRNQ